MKMSEIYNTAIPVCCIMYMDTLRQAVLQETFAECVRTMMKRSEIMV